MENTNTYLSQGTLDDLDFLQQRANQLVQDQAVIEERLININKKQEQIRQLRSRKQELITEIQEEETGPESLLPPAANEDNVSDDLKRLLLKRHLLEEVKAAYRLLGQTLTVIDKSTVRVCIDTCFQGEFSVPHYVELGLKDSGPIVLQHTMPSFINMESASRILKSGIPEFVNYIQLHLQAYHIRKAFIIRVQGDFADFLEEQIQATPSADWVRLSLKEVERCGGRYVTIQLKYSDVTSWKPARAKVTVHVDDDSDDANIDQASIADQCAMITDIMTSTNLPEAIAAVLIPPDSEIENVKRRNSIESQ